MSNNKNILYCSFCGKSQHEVRKLIAGPTVFICDECVELCMQSSTHSSQMNTVGPAISFLTSCWLLPQKEQYKIFLLLLIIFLTNQLRHFITIDSY